MNRAKAIHFRRHGSIYVIVLGMAMLVSTITLGATLASRILIRNGSAASDFALARLCARAGLDVAVYKIQSDPNWRTDLGNGAWYTNVALGSGAFSVSASDPISGNVAAASNDPVVLTCTGTKGAAVYVLQAQVQVSTPGLNCLTVNMCSAGNTSLNNCVLNSNQICASNGNYNPDGGSTVNANAEAHGNLGNGAYIKCTQTLPAALVLPDPTHVFDYYNANGTAIPYTALKQSNNTQIINNPSFETNIAGWYVYSPSSTSVLLSQDTTQHRDGGASLLISKRAGAGDVPAQDLPALSVRCGDTYAVTVPVYAKATGSVQATLVIVSSNGTQSFSTPAVQLNANGAWVNCQGHVTINWSGTLTKATLTLTCSNTAANLNIDAVSLTDTSLPGNAYVMDRVLLSPASNPYGPTNSQGIYIIDCQGQTVTVDSCRIVGTLVLLNAGGNTTIAGPIMWEPAVAGYPALLCDKNLTIAFDSNVGLSESTFGINFNPSGTPYPYLTGSNSNTNAIDAYPSAINGLIYCGGNLTVSINPAIVGCVVCAGNIQLQSTAVNLVYGNASYTIPPPGFGTTMPTIYPTPGSWQRTTN